MAAANGLSVKFDANSLVNDDDDKPDKGKSKAKAKPATPAPDPKSVITPVPTGSSPGLNPKVDVSKIVPPANVMSPKDFNISYVQSPEYQRRLSLTGRGTKPQSPEDLFNTQITHDANAASEAFPKFPGPRGVNRININPAQLNSLHASNDEVLSHEFSHITRQLSPGEQNTILSLNKSPNAAIARDTYAKDGQGQPLDKFIGGSKLGNQFHDAQPAESKADLDALRYLMYKKGIYNTGKGQLDLPTLNKALSDPEIKNSPVAKRLLQNFDIDSILKLNNTIAMNKPTHSNSLIS